MVENMRNKLNNRAQQAFLISESKSNIFTPVQMMQSILT